MKIFIDFFLVLSMGILIYSLFPISFNAKVCQCMYCNGNTQCAWVQTAAFNMACQKKIAKQAACLKMLSL